MSQKNYTIPAELVLQFEAWGKLTAELFAAIRRHAERQVANETNGHIWKQANEWQVRENRVADELTDEGTRKPQNAEEVISDMYTLRHEIIQIARKMPGYGIKRRSKEPSKVNS